MTEQVSTAPSAGRRILVLCPFPTGTVPAQRLKYEQYFDDWRAHGYEITVSPFFDERAYRCLYRPRSIVPKVTGAIRGYLRRASDLVRIGRFDLVYVFLWVTPFGPPITERIVRSRARSLVYDIDDLVYRPDARSDVNRAVSRLRGRHKPRTLMQSADQVIVSTPYLARIARSYNAKVSDISCTVDTDRVHPRPPVSRNPVPVIGWSGSFSTIPYLESLGPALQGLAATHHFVLRVIGAERFELPGVQVDTVPWSASTEAGLVADLDIGLHPVPADEWTLGKSGGKTFLYLAAGVPVVADAVGANFRSVEDGVNGFLVHDLDEWTDRLRLLLDDPVLRHRMGAAARRTAETWFSTRVTAPVYRAVLAAALTGADAPDTLPYPQPVGAPIDRLAGA